MENILIFIFETLVVDTKIFFNEPTEPSKRINYMPAVMNMLLQLDMKGHHVAVATPSPMQWLKSRQIENVVPSVLLYSLEDSQKTNPNIFKEVLAMENFFNLADAKLHIIVNQKDHVYDALEIENAKVLYISKNHLEFNKNSRVVYFDDSKELAEKLINLKK